MVLVLKMRVLPVCLCCWLDSNILFIYKFIAVTDELVSEIQLWALFQFKIVYLIF